MFARFLALGVWKTLSCVTRICPPGISLAPVVISRSQLIWRAWIFLMKWDQYIPSRSNWREGTEAQGTMILYDIYYIYAYSYNVNLLSRTYGKWKASSHQKPNDKLDTTFLKYNLFTNYTWLFLILNCHFASINFSFFTKKKVLEDWLPRNGPTLGLGSTHFAMDGVTCYRGGSILRYVGPNHRQIDFKCSKIRKHTHDFAGFETLCNYNPSRAIPR